jgi:hypothetical protein
MIHARRNCNGCLGEKALTSFLMDKLKSLVKEKLFRRMLHSMKVEQLLANKSDSQKAFCIVHWNAPHFLLLNVKRIELLHPEAKIYILDNASSNNNLKTILNELKSYENITLFSNKHDYSKTWACHIIGLQFLLNYAAQNSDSIATFLDQDCILVRRVDDLANKLNGKDVLLIGARDYVEIPRDYGPLKKGNLRNFPNAVHGSFMIMQPVVIHDLFGDQSLINGKSFEPYHGIARKTAGKILFLETQMHDKIPLLTRYTFGEKTYAWHAWYSSRIVGMKDIGHVDSLPVSWLKECLREAYEFMEQLPLEYEQ